MIALVTLGLFAGYTLTYAAVKGGNLVYHPWEALRPG